MSGREGKGSAILKSATEADVEAAADLSDKAEEQIAETQKKAVDTLAEARERGQQITAEILSMIDTVGTTLLLEVTLLSGMCKGVDSGLAIAVRFGSPGTRTPLHMTCDSCRTPPRPSSAVRI